MFDNLRDETSSFQDPTDPKFGPASSTTSGRLTRKGRFLGMTSIQRFVIAVLLMSTTCVFGMMCLFLTGKIGF